jgi:hypothetical protein
MTGLNYTLMKIRHLADEVVSLPRAVEIAQGVDGRRKIGRIESATQKVRMARRQRSLFSLLRKRELGTKCRKIDASRFDVSTTFPSRKRIGSIIGLDAPSPSYGRKTP